MKLFYFLAVLICTLMLNVSKAQSKYPGYVITITGDTIFCKITASRTGKVKYQNDAMPESKKITIDEIKEYRFTAKSNLVRAITPEEGAKPIFMEQIENGTIKLYEDFRTNYIGISKSYSFDWYIIKGAGNIIPVIREGLFTGSAEKEFRKTFIELIRDKTIVYNKLISDNDFSLDEIRAIIVYYNTGVYTPSNTPDYRY